MEEDVRSLNIKESFLTLTQYLPEIRDYKDLADVYKKARFGISMNFDLYDYVNELVATKEKSGKIIYRGKTLDLTNFWTELEKRNILIKTWLIENTEDDSGVSGYDYKE